MKRKQTKEELFAARQKREETVASRIAEYTKNGWWDRDVNDDPPTVPLQIEQVDYLNKKWKNRVGCRIANRVATAYYEREIRAHRMIVKEVRGLENFTAVKGGAVLTCNHFSPYDNYAVYRPIRPYMKGKNLWKIIREGNFTSFPGLYGYFFRHCNTLPLSENFSILKLLLEAVKTLLSRGEKILIYPEQALWPDYKKPRPLKNGAFNMAANNKVPVIPFFITFTDSEKYRFPDGSPAKEYTVHILPAIYPDENLSVKENTAMMRDRNFAAWKALYEEVYGEKLDYGV